MNLLRKFYFLFVLASLVVLVFYLGFLYGLREKENVKPANLTITNPNFNQKNTISDIDERNVFGVAVENNAIVKKPYGKMYFVINEKGQTEIDIRLENIPASLQQPTTKAEVQIPNELRVDVAQRTRDGTGLDDYEYINLSPEPDQALAKVVLTPAENNLRRGKFSGIIQQRIFDPSGNRNSIERIVLRSVDPAVQNIFVDTDVNLPLKIRGNPNTNPPIEGKAAPFFWADF